MELAPAGGIQSVERKYRGDTLVLETTFHTDDGTVLVIDCMPIRRKVVELVRVVEGVSGSVPMHMDLLVRFDYGSILPWVERRDGRLHWTAGADSMVLTTPVVIERLSDRTVADFVTRPGDRVPFVLAGIPRTSRHRGPATRSGSSETRPHRGDDGRRRAVTTARPATS